MSFLQDKIVLYLDCVQVASSEWGEETRSQIDTNGNVYLARDDNDKSVEVR